MLFGKILLKVKIIGSNEIVFYSYLTYNKNYSNFKLNLEQIKYFLSFLIKKKTKENFNIWIKIIKCKTSSVIDLFWKRNLKIFKICYPQISLFFGLLGRIYYKKKF